MTPTEPPPLPEKAKKFKIARYNQVLLGLAYGFSILLFVLSPDKGPERIGYMVGLILGWTLFPLLLAYVAYWISGRRNAASSIVFTIMLLLSVLGHVGTIGRKAAENRAVEQGVMALQEKQAQAKRAFEESGDVEAWSDSFDSYVDETRGTFAELAASTTGKQKQFFEIMGAFVQDSTEVLDGWSAAFDRVSEDRILDFSRLTTQEEYDYQLQAVDAYHAETTRYAAYFAGMIPELESRLKALGQEDPTAAEAIESARAKHQLQQPVFEPLMQAHLDYADAMLGMLQLLYETHGYWSWEDGQVWFEEDLPIAEFNVFIDQLGHAEERINTLAAELIKRS